ncbi:YbaB/EbfC family nucleoid-associated protein [Rhodococcus sp. NPDC057135]|uniref:YbaB/EbfC family nucleoid-associated protein n=1 Tax=Rhodococcus sp. NPDC057135 TaxID=3346028 RepID=UPI003624B810
MNPNRSINADIEALQRRARQVQADIGKLRGNGNDRSGTVSAEVDAAGRLQHLTIPPQALRHGADRLAAMVIEASRNAERDAQARAVEMARPLTEDPRVVESINVIRKFTGTDLPADPRQATPVVGESNGENFSVLQPVETPRR